MVLFMEKLIDKLKLYIWECGRIRYLKNITSNIGKVVIKDDKIVCYVDQKLLDKNGKEKYGTYDLMLFGTGNKCDVEHQKLIKNFNLDKPFYYVFDGIKFDKALAISCYFGNIEFKNCSFHENIKIHEADEVIFENNKYYDFNGLYYYGKCFLTGTMEKLAIWNDNFQNSQSIVSGISCPNFGIDVNVKEISIIASTVKSDIRGLINIKADKSVVVASNIDVPEIYLDSKKMVWVNNSIKASNGVIIENENYDFNGVINSPVVIYNGTDISKVDAKDKIVNIDTVDMVEARQNWVNYLNNLKDYCILLNSSRTVNDTVSDKNVLVKK